MPVPSVTLQSSLSAEEVRFLEDRLYEFNVSATGIADGEWLNLVGRDGAGNLVAQLAGSTWGGCCEIRLLWVHEGWRGQGLGRRIMEAAEAEAVRRGCGQIVLNTHSFQAPEFYRRLGFAVVATLEDYPRGHRQIILRKRLSAPA